MKNFDKKVVATAVAFVTAARTVAGAIANSGVSGAGDSNASGPGFNPAGYVYAAGVVAAFAGAAVAYCTRKSCNFFCKRNGDGNAEGNSADNNPYTAV